MVGWLKISREITNHWLWQDAERLKWWFDLLFLANWEDRQVMHDSHLFTLKRGQIIASINYLSERWGKSNPTIIKFLKLLEVEGMVYRQTLYRQTPIITICNYDKYQVLDAPQVDRQVDTQVYTQVDRQVYTNKEIKEINIYNQQQRAREKETEYIGNLKKSQIWLEQMAMRFHITTAEVVNRLDDFTLDCDCRGTIHNNANDAQKHFNDWLRIQLTKREEYVTDKQRNQDKRRQAEITATSAEDYKCSF